MWPILLSVASFLSTFIGGVAVLFNQKWLRAIMGYTAGVLLGVVAFELLPEIAAEVNKTNISFTRPMVALVLGFLLFHILEKTILLHHGHEQEYGPHRHPDVGIASALALSGHSFLDGVGIGLGFQASPAVGVAIAIAVIAHDFTDGINTITLMLHHGNSSSKAKKMLLLDAAAPVLGAVSTIFFSLPVSWLVLYLGFFAGFLLYIGASDILPQAHNQKSSGLTVFLTVAGVLFIFLISRLS